MDKLIWYLRQLLPLYYETHYGNEQGWHFVTWRMWFGRCFGINDRLCSDAGR